MSEDEIDALKLQLLSSLKPTPDLAGIRSALSGLKDELINGSGPHQVSYLLENVYHAELPKRQKGDGKTEDGSPTLSFDELKGKDVDSVKVLREAAEAEDYRIFLVNLVISRSGDAIPTREELDESYGEDSLLPPGEPFTPLGYRRFDFRSINEVEVSDDVVPAGEPKALVAPVAGDNIDLRDASYEFDLYTLCERAVKAPLSDEKDGEDEKEEGEEEEDPFPEAEVDVLAGREPHVEDWDGMNHLDGGPLGQTFYVTAVVLWPSEAHDENVRKIDPKATEKSVKGGDAKRARDEVDGEAEEAAGDKKKAK